MSLTGTQPISLGERQLANNQAPGISIGLRAAAIAALLLASGGVLQAEEETYAQRQACKPDVFKLCSAFIPRRKPITECLERNYSRLSEPCRAVFDGRLR
jgi:hypothetical protein